MSSKEDCHAADMKSAPRQNTEHQVSDAWASVLLALILDSMALTDPPPSP